MPRFPLRSFPVALAGPAGSIAHAAAGATSRGKYPTKFNGMLWNTGGDLLTVATKAGERLRLRP